MFVAGEGILCLSLDSCDTNPEFAAEATDNTQMRGGVTWRKFAAEATGITQMRWSNVEKLQESLK